MPNVERTSVFRELEGKQQNLRIWTLETSRRDSDAENITPRLPTGKQTELSIKIIYFD